MTAIDLSRRSLIAPKTSLIPRASGGSFKRNEHKIVINVGGVRYETYRSTLKNIPDTRLAWLTNSRGHNPEFDPESGEFFFDRHPGVFNMILNYYRTGKLHAPTDVCGPLFEDELNFWGLDEKQIEPCCWPNYRAHRDAQETLAEMDGADAISNESDSESSHLEDIREKFGIIEEHSNENKSFCARMIPRMWRLLDEPKSSLSAKVFAFVSLTILIISIMSFCLESHIMFREPIHPNSTFTITTVREKETMTKPMFFLDVIEYICVTFFTIEIVLRLVFCPDIKQFLRKVFNWIDMSIVIPCYTCFILLIIDPDIRSSNIFRFINALRLTRIFKILKLTVHVSGLKILGHTIKASAKELLLLVLVLIIGVLIFACLIYYAEQVDEANINSFSNIPSGFWWAVVTMTTLGYGDLYPRTALGYIIGTVCAVSGLLMLSLPVPVIVSNFTLYYTHAQARLKLPKKSKKKALLSAANALVDPSDAVCDTGSEDSKTSRTTNSEDSAFDKFKEVSETYLRGKRRSAPPTFGGKNGCAGISVVFTSDDTPAEEEHNALPMETPSDDVNDDVTDEENDTSTGSRNDSLTPHTSHSSESRTPQRQRRVGGKNGCAGISVVFTSDDTPAEEDHHALPMETPSDDVNDDVTDEENDASTGSRNDSLTPHTSHSSESRTPQRQRRVGGKNGCAGISVVFTSDDTPAEEDHHALPMETPSDDVNDDVTDEENDASTGSRNDSLTPHTSHSSESRTPQRQRRVSLLPGYSSSRRNSAR